MKTYLSLLALLCCQTAFGESIASSSQGLPFQLEAVGPNVYAAIDKPDHRGLANAGFVIGQDAVILGHRNIRDWIHSENLKFFGPAIKPEQRASIEGLAAPEIGYDSFVELYLGSRQLLVRVLPGHTGGDSVVVVPDAQVVFCGDLFWKATLPNLIDASTAPLMATDEKLSQTFPRARFVPGHGAVGDAGDVRAFVGYVGDLRSSVVGARGRGLGGDALVDAVLPGLQQKYGQWDFFAHFAKRNILDTERELLGTKRLPAATAPPVL
jgi:cyclase